MIKTAFPETYKELVDEKKLFLRRHHLFTFGLVYGLLHNLSSKKRPDSDMVYLNQIKERVTNDIIDIVYLLLDNGDKKEDEIFAEMLIIADSGVEQLAKVYKVNSDFRIPNLILEAEKLWQDRISELKNIGIRSSE
jgi:hypothetical protein